MGTLTADRNLGRVAPSIFNLSVLNRHWNVCIFKYLSILRNSRSGNATYIPISLYRHFSQIGRVRRQLTERNLLRGLKLQQWRLRLREDENSLQTNSNLASRWKCVTDFCGLSTCICGLKVQLSEISTPLTIFIGMASVGVFYNFWSFDRICQVAPIWTPI